jgi:tRNA pseudouridine32 synthase/23S rRNA pseudouridine746 synthase
VQNPFDEQPPDPRAQDAARALMAELPELREGKMYGVLVAKTGEVLRAFSAGVDAPGFSPHVFDARARAEIEPASDALVKSLTARLPSLEEREQAVQGIEAEREALRTLHLARRKARHAQPRTPALDDESRRDGRERKDFELRAEAKLATFIPVTRRYQAVERLRRIVSREAMRRIHDTYVLRNAQGEETTLRALFAPAEPPWGAGECAAVKLLSEALRRGLEPLALAEFWWGPPPAGGGRVHGTFYPACRTKCGPVLPFLMRGLEVTPRRAWMPRPLAPLEILFEDAWLAVVAKPAGLLSVPGKTESDSVLQRLRVRHPNATLVHRLDLDTSGVLLAALDGDTHRALQRQFLSRTVEKRYVACLEGDVEGDGGTICLPLRVDLEQRPRQLVCFTHGKKAVTDWRVLERSAGRTWVELLPRTGRTHQLRVHAAHASGLKAPIVGDRLYGRDGERLMLHAQALTFTHPATGERVTFQSAMPLSTAPTASSP